MSNPIDRLAAIDALMSILDRENHAEFLYTDEICNALEELPSAQPETCEGCRHLGKWENEVEYGYPSPCTRCKRRVEDHYER